MKKRYLFLGGVVLLAFALNVTNRPTPPASPEEQARQEEVRKKTEARQAYVAHPVIRGREAARKLEAINSQSNGPIAEAVQNIQAYASSNGQKSMNARLMGNAALAFDSMAEKYRDFAVPAGLPDKAAEGLTAALARLRQSAEAGTDAFLELQRLVEAKGRADMKSINASLNKATSLRNEGVKLLEKAKSELAAMDAPQWVE